MQMVVHNFFFLFYYGFNGWILNALNYCCESNIVLVVCVNVRWGLKFKVWFFLCVLSSWYFVPFFASCYMLLVGVSYFVECLMVICNLLLTKLIVLSFDFHWYGFWWWCMQLDDFCGMLHEVFENVKSDNISTGVQPNLTIDIGV